MKQRTLQWNVVKDDGGQALTEFAIVIPIVLLMFFAILQYFYVVRASQLGNYAAYVAARSYVVLHNKEDAQTAAVIALAPIGRPVPGELGFGVFNFSPANIPGLSGLLQQNTEYAADYAKGYVYVSQFRFRSSILGGGVDIATNGNPVQVNVNINYPQPIFVPGLAGLWNLVTGERIYHELEPLSQGLTGIPGTVLPILSASDQVQEWLARFNYQAPNLPFVIYPYVNVRSKCSMGYEYWSGTLRIRSNNTSLDELPDPNEAADATGGLAPDVGNLSNLLPSLIGIP